MLNIIIEIPNIPLKEAEKALKYIKDQVKNFPIESTFIWRDGFAIFWQSTPLIVKGPKITPYDKTHLENKNYDNLPAAASNFIKKHLTLYKIAPNSNINNNTVNFYEENNILYFTTYQQFDLIKLIKNIPWIKPIKIGDDTVTRPVKNIYISYEPNEDDTFATIKPEKKDFTIDSFIEFYKKQNMLVGFEDKINNLIKLNIFSKEIIKTFYNKNRDLLHNTSNPTVVFIPLKDKYKSIPNYLIDFIISLEQRVLTVYKEDILIGFNFIIDKPIENLEVDKFSIVIDSRLEDLKISYERDKKIVEFNSNYYNPKLFTLIKELVRHFNVEVDNSILDFISRNLNRDFNTSLGEEYPSLLGILSGLIYKDNNKDYKEEIFNGFMSLQGAIKNNYGLLIYMGEKLCFLRDVAEKNQLATSTKDPFATKDLVDNILKLFEEKGWGFPYDLISDNNLRDFVNRRIEVGKNKNKEL